MKKGRKGENIEKSTPEHKVIFSPTAENNSDIQSNEELLLFSKCLIFDQNSRSEKLDLNNNSVPCLARL
jgi:hypothetical protein